jgi:hypothetical protein
VGASHEDGRSEQTCASFTLRDEGCSGGLLEELDAQRLRDIEDQKNLSLTMAERHGGYKEVAL